MASTSDRAAAELELPLKNKGAEGHPQRLSLLDVNPAPKAPGAGTAMDIIEEALNGHGARPPMHVPADIRQLAVVTTSGFSDKHGELHLFERADEHKPWRATGFDINVNVGERGMAWGKGGLIHRESVMQNGELQRVGGPLLGYSPDGKATCDASGNAKCEGDMKTTAGLFRLGLAWGTSDSRTWPNNEAPPGTTMPYRRLDPDYRVVPSTTEPIIDQQGRKLSGTIIRELDPSQGTYERYENGAFIKGTLSAQALSKLERETQNSDAHYRWVHKDVKDSQGRPLSEMLVRVHDIDPQHPAFENPSAPSYLEGPRGTQLAFNDGAYDAIDLRTGQTFKGEVDKKTSKAIFNDSDYRWGDILDRGHKLLGRIDGQPLYSEKADDYLYNHPVRVIDAQTGEYEHLDPATGKSLGRGQADQATMHNLLNENEDMNDAYYRYAINILQNTGQQPKGGSALFVHQEAYLRRTGNQPDDTAGCISMSVENIRAMLTSLQKSKNPSILITPLDQLETVRQGLE